MSWTRRACSTDRKSTRLNSSHANMSYAVFCLKKKDLEPDDVLDLSIFLRINHDATSPTRRGCLRFREELCVAYGVKYGSAGVHWTQRAPLQKTVSVARRSEEDQEDAVRVLRYTQAGARHFFFK